MAILKISDVESSFPPVIFQKTTQTATELLTTSGQQVKVNLGTDTSTTHISMVDSVLTFLETGNFSFRGVFNIRAGGAGPAPGITQKNYFFICARLNNNIISSPGCSPKVVTIKSSGISKYYYDTVILRTDIFYAVAGDTFQITAWYADDISTETQTIGTFNVNYGAPTGACTIPSNSDAAFINLYNHD